MTAPDPGPAGPGDPGHQDTGPQDSGPQDSGPQDSGHQGTARVRRAHLAVVAVTGTVSGVAFAVALALSAGALPERMASHFTVSGVPDQFLATPLAVAGAALLGVGVPALLIAVFLSVRWWLGAQARLVSGFLAGLSVGLPAMFAAQIWAHRGVTDPTEVRFGILTGLVVLGVAVLVGVLTALALPSPPPQPAPEEVTPTRLEEWERVAWFGQAQLSGWMTIVLVLGLVVAVGGALLGGQWWLWLLVPFLLVITLSVCAFTVSVGPDGLRWRSALGFPRGHLPLSRITGAGVVQVRPADFGGYGYRRRPGVLGLITRGGPALQVEYGDRTLVVTVSEPAVAAGLLLGLQDRVER